MTATGERLDDLTAVERTLLLTLCGRAADAASASPLLADTVAAEVASRIDESVRSASAGDADLARNVAIRARLLDDHVRDFVRRHPDAVVVELGCGLETRAFRTELPETVDYYAVDLLSVIELRRRLMPHHPRETMIAASLDDPRWTDAIPSGRAAILVADGVLAFLDPAVATRLLTTLTEHFPHGELVCQVNITWLSRDLGRAPELRKVGIPRGFQGFGIDDTADVERLNPRLRFVDEFVLARAPEHFPGFSRRFRTILRLLRLRTSWARLSAWVVRYRF
ncbi:hypothetical protein B1813_00895 [Saccharomonospora piscinae]|uniref:O-methyltransferase involved in polyketide biosynthesis n=1 Tax=Saccharomonospora piscinae TaxID=687388 RepID=A0A1V9ACP2_SACPI|nr:class I SAM-dependent methyltransferase [Saccharomonospora piscinae]OQO94694.1 hypothetical protein B1813_00895 [Saccharomonospora piscinae]